MKRYCHFEPGRFDVDQFDPVQGELYLHTRGQQPPHTNDGALWGDDPVIGPDSGGGPVLGPTMDASLGDRASNDGGGIV